MEKRKHLIIQVILTIVVFFAYFLELSRRRGPLVESLKRLSPLFLGITFFAFIILLILGAKKIVLPFASLKRNHLIILGLVALFAFCLSFFVAPRTHRIYYDENIYLHIGQSIAYSGRAQMVNFGEIKYGELFVRQGEYNKQPNSYPFLLSILYRIFGCRENLSFLFNNITFVLSVLTVFGIAYLLFKSFKIGIYAALAAAVIPQNILWHNTTSVEPSNTLFLALTIFLLLSATRSSSLRLYFLAVVSGCFAAQFRVESLLIFPLLIIIVGLTDRKAFREQKIYYAVPLALGLLLPHILHLYYFRGHPWGAVGTQEKLSLGFLGHNLATNGGFFLNNKDFPVLLTLFAVLAFLSRRFVRERLLLLMWFAFFWGVFLFFYAGSYNYGADVRFSLMAFPSLAVMAAFGLATLDDLIRKHAKIQGPFALSVIVLAFLAFAPKARTVGQEAWAARADHFYAREMLKQIPENSIVFTHNPCLFLFWGKSSAQASILTAQDENGLRGLRDSFPGGLYFHYNYWCNVSDPVQTGFCKSVLEKFGHEEVVRYKERDYEYVLYRLD